MVLLFAERFLPEDMADFVIEDDDFRERVFEGACEKIIDRLSSISFLRGYEWMGKQAFYNDEDAKTYHLKDMFDVTFDGQNFDITNYKEVFGKNGAHYNLFELLWNGFGPYSVPQRTRAAQTEPEYYAYMMRTKKSRGEFRWMTLDGSPMRYYYRYPGIMVKYATHRGGMNTSLNTKFQTYVEDAVRKGVHSSFIEQMSGHWRR